jgi:peroxiredoxin
MALLETPPLDNDKQAPDFTLKNVDGQDVSLADAMGKNGTVIAFICNHCPYVLAVIERFVATANKLKDKGINTIAIMPNDTANYPADSYENMIEFAQKYAFKFPYLIDETQDVATAYGAVCTPDIFGIDSDGQIQYRGRLDSAGKGDADEQTVPELYNAMLEIADNKDVSAQQFPSMGCSIKWK